ncbi:MAG: hypothetical protein K1000chlam4_00051 [Chlamydiae bacterium]|nr:hypothetical protein [Chlamydiota bacterium]
MSSSSMSPTSGSELPQLTCDFLTGQFKKKVDKHGMEEGCSRLAEKLIPRYSLRDFLELKLAVNINTASESFLKSLGLDELMLIPLVSNVSDTLLTEKQKYCFYERINESIEADKRGEALEKILQLPLEYLEGQDRWLAGLAPVFIKDKDWSNAARAINHLPDGPEKSALANQCPDFHAESETLVLEHVFRFFHKVAPNGINSSNEEEIRKKILDMRQQWREIYSVRDFEKLTRHVAWEKEQLSELNHSGYFRFIAMMNDLAPVFLFDKKMHQFGKEKNYKGVLEQIRECPYLSAAEKEEKYRSLFEAFMSDGDVENAVLALSYLPESPEKMALTVRTTGAHFLGVAGSLLGSSPTVEWPKGRELEQMVATEWKDKQAKMDKYLSRDLESLEKELASIQGQMEQLTIEKDRAMLTNNDTIIRQALDNFFDAEEARGMIQGAINRKRQDLPEASSSSGKQAKMNKYFSWDLEKLERKLLILNVRIGHHYRDKERARVERPDDEFLNKSIRDGLAELEKTRSLVIDVIKRKRQALPEATSSSGKSGATTSSSAPGVDEDPEEQIVEEIVRVIEQEPPLKVHTPPPAPEKKDCVIV